MDVKPPKIDNAPGLKWKRRKNGWEARWEPRTDLRERGYPLSSQGLRLWYGETLDEVEIALLQERCNSLQDDMLVWARGGVQPMARFDKTIDGLIQCYMTDPDSTFRKNRYKTRKYYTTLCRLLTATKWQTDEGIELTIGQTPISEIKARVLLRWHRQWIEGGKTAKAHAMIGMLRTLCTFGKTILEDDDCVRLSGVLSGMKFAMPKPRVETLSAEQAQLIIAEANNRGLKSMALAQAIQFEATLRQKDVIGEWIPLEDPGVSDTINGSKKWLRGLRWEEIDANFVFIHVTSKRQKEIEVDLMLAPMVMAELGNLPRVVFPASGPVIIRESTGRPWDDNEFRKVWRKLARACGIPDAVKNMDSRAGAITEATDAGADLEHVKQAATHGDISMTQRYSRGAAKKIAGVMRTRVAHRNKEGA